MKRKIINILITILVGFVIFYFTIPALNITSPSLYVFLGFLIIFYSLLDAGTKIIELVNRKRFKFEWSPIIILPIMVIAIFVLNFISSPVFNSKAYATRISIDETGDFSRDIAQVDFDKVPLLDKSSSQKLGDRIMGEMSDLVSQYYVSDLYTQINYNDSIVRVTPLEYAGLIKYFTNRKDGIKGYITVNSVTGEAKMERLEHGMKYVPSAIFNEDMMRHLRFKYPTEIFGEYSFEIDDEGSPYFVIPTIKYKMIGLRPDIDGVIILNPIDGSTTKYDVGKVPNWIDNVFKADLIIEQADDWGTYGGGFLNSMFAQKNVTNTTDGYNYLAMDGDIYLYTGITSVQNDESNLGFILSNLRTKETIFYSMPGAEEYSAMASAEGQVQEMKYTSTFPLLINLNGRATYLVSLKDNAGLVKKYAFIDVQDYQKVYVDDVKLGIEKVSKLYLDAFKLEGEIKTVSGKIKIKSITDAIIDGNTFYYLEDTDGKRYSVSIAVERNILPFLKAGDELDITYVDGNVRTIKTIEGK
ncbi:MAG TPA: hypothetical protein DCY94_05080 [Firmicutes bacterium]|nr:hypothetical protein [Bacillota bacterium]